MNADSWYPATADESQPPGKRVKSTARRMRKVRKELAKPPSLRESPKAVERRRQQRTREAVRKKKAAREKERMNKVYLVKSGRLATLDEWVAKEVWKR